MGVYRDPVITAADHASTHITGGSDVIADAVAGGASGLMSGTVRDYLDQAVKTTSSPTFANITDSGLTASRAVVTDGSKVLTSSAVTSTELGYVSGVTSAIQTQFSQTQGSVLDKKLYYSTNTKLGDDGNSTWVNEAWGDGDSGVYAADSTNVKIGTKSAKCTGAADGDGIHYVVSRNFNAFNDGSTSGTTDYIYVVIYVADVTKLNTGIKIIVANDAFGTVTNYLHYTIPTASLVTGWNYKEIVKSDFTAVGTGTFTSITGFSVAFAGAPSSSTYFSVQLIQLIRDDPSSAAANLFQRNVNGTWTRDFADNAQWFLGLENGELVCRNMSTSAVGDALTGVAVFSNAILALKFKIKATSGAYNMNEYLKWYSNATNYFECYVYNNTLRLNAFLAGVETQAAGLAMTIVTGDEVTLTLIKNGSGITVIGTINNSDVLYSRSLSINYGTLTGYLQIGALGSAQDTLQSLSVTVTNHAYHSEITETTKNNAVLYNAGVFTAATLPVNTYGIDTTNHRLYVKYLDGTIKYASLT